MDKDSAARLGLGTFDQVGFVVEDMDRALPRYEALYGPFRVGEAPLSDVTFRGHPENTFRLLGNAIFTGLD